MPKVPALIAVLVLATSCGGDEPSSTTTASAPGAIDIAPTTTRADTDELDLVILSDSLALGGWPQQWADLAERDLGVDVVLHDLSVRGKADYDAILAESDVRSTVGDAEIVFISPDPDYLREACPPGTASPDCVTEFAAEYRTRWTGWLEDIAALSGEAVLRSAEAWVWLAPSGNRDGLIEFMGEMADATMDHDGRVADLNRALTGEGLDEEPPAGSIDATGHLVGPGADAMAQLLHELGYDSSG